MTPEERAARRENLRAHREVRWLIDKSSLGNRSAADLVTEERKRRQDGKPTMTDAEYLALIERAKK